MRQKPLLLTGLAFFVFACQSTNDIDKWESSGPDPFTAEYNKDSLLFLADSLLSINFLDSIEYNTIKKSIDDSTCSSRTQIFSHSDSATYITMDDYYLGAEEGHPGLVQRIKEMKAFDQLKSIHFQEIPEPDWENEEYLMTEATEEAIPDEELYSRYRVHIRFSDWEGEMKCEYLSDCHELLNDYLQFKNSMQRVHIVYPWRDYHNEVELPYCTLMLTHEDRFHKLDSMRFKWKLGLVCSFADYPRFVELEHWISTCQTLASLGLLPSNFDVQGTAQELYKLRSDNFMDLYLRIPNLIFSTSEIDENDSLKHFKTFQAFEKISRGQFRPRNLKNATAEHNEWELYDYAWIDYELNGQHYGCEFDYSGSVHMVSSLVDQLDSTTNIKSGKFYQVYGAHVGYEEDYYIYLSYEQYKRLKFSTRMFFTPEKGSANIGEFDNMSYEDFLSFESSCSIMMMPFYNGVSSHDTTGRAEDLKYDLAEYGEYPDY